MRFETTRFLHRRYYWDAAARIQHEYCTRRARWDYRFKGWRLEQRA